MCIEYEIMIRDPRPAERRQTKYSRGRNSDSFDPKSTLARPDMRIIHELTSNEYPRALKHDDVVVVPRFESPGAYSDLLSEIEALQYHGEEGSEYISWHEGCHLLVQHPEKSATFQTIITKICRYFDIDKDTIAVRYNFYKDDVDWKSAHHDSAAFNRSRAKRQNITVGLSLGRTRELFFKHAKKGTVINMPMPSGSLYSFGKAVNIRFMHGITAVPEDEQRDEGRISIIVWGLSRKTVDEPNEPTILEDNDRRPKNNHRHRRHGQYTAHNPPSSVSDSNLGSNT